MDLRLFRQTCRLKVSVNGTEHVVRLLFRHQEPQGLNSRPVGGRVQLDTLGWHDTQDVKVLEILPWEDPQTDKMALDTK